MSQNPILIGGCGRSGTTLLLSLLSTHPRVYAISRETQAFTPGGYPLEGEVSTDGDFRMDFVCSELIEEKNLEKYDRWCEKTPMNVHYYERLKKYFGSEMRFLNIVRDGRSVITSRHPNDPHSYWVSPSRWVRDVRAGRNIEEDDQCLTVKYEDIIHDHIGCMKEICKFIGEKYSQKVEAYPETAGVKSSNAWFTGAEPVRRKSEGRWKKDEHQEVVNELLDIPEAVDHLNHYGYL